MAVNNLIKLRRGTASDWSSNPTLAQGEPGFDTTNNILKIGDGTTAWNSLAAVNNTDHPTISAASSSDNSGNTFIQDITLDSNGHVTAITVATASEGGGGGIGSVVEDTTPQLGGNLDLNSKNLTGTGHIDITGSGHFSAKVEANSFVKTAGTSSQFLKADGSVDTSTYSTTDTQLTEEQVEDFVGGMVTGNTETGITVTYQDDDGTIDFVVASQTDENFTTADHSKLDGIEASADVTDTANVTSAGALMDSEVTNLSQVKAFDSSDYATAAQGTKADSAQQPPSEGAFANGDKTKLDGIEASADVTDTANVTSAGALMDSELTDLAGVKGVTISTLQVKPSEGAFADGDKTKLDAIEASADVTDTANVTSAGALMDSEVTNLSEVKAFDSSDYATAAQGTKADSAQQPPSEGAFANGDKTKLDGIEASADVTDAANVTAAGALMDSELASITDVKALDQSVIAGASPNLVTTNMTDASNKRFMTDAQETKLDSVESSADVTDTANVTSAGALMDSELTDLAGVKGVTISTLQVKPSEGAFANGDKTKLDAIEASADVTDATNVNAAGAVMNSDSTTAGMSFVVDEDNMSSDSDTKVPTQQSVKAYVDATIVPALTTEQVQDIVGGMVDDTETGISVTYDDTNGNLEFVVDHDAANNFVANEHIDHTSVTLTAGDGLTGGGDISANRTFAVSVDDSTIEINSDTLRIKDDGVTSAKIGALTDLLRWEYPDKALDGNVASLGYLRAYDESGGYAGFGVSTSSFNIGTSGAINMRFITAGSERAIINNDGDFIFNEAGASVDFRVEGDTNQNLLFVDGSADKVGIGTNSPAGILHVKGEYSDGGHITIEDTSSALKTRFYNGNTASVIAVDEGDAVGTSSLQISVDNSTKATFGASATTFDQNVTINASTNQAVIGNSVTVFNEGGANIDFRVEGDTDANLLFLDASKDSVLIGNSTDGSINSKLHVYEANKTNSTYSRTINVLGRAYSTTDGSYFHIGLNSRAEKYLSASTTDGGYAIGVNAVPVIYSPDGTNTLAELTAVRANMSINSAASNVTVTNAFDIKTIPSLQGTNNTVTNHYGLYLSDAGGGNTTVTNEYGVYQVSTDAKNYFGGTLDVRGAAVFNEGGAAVDFRVEGDTDIDLLFVDGSEDTVQIGKLNINGAFTFPTADGSANQILKTDGNGAVSWAADGGSGSSLTEEQVEDFVGGMVTGNTETFITVTYEDGDGTLDFVVPVKDEDNMASDSATHLATQQSIKAYVDANAGGGGGSMTTVKANGTQVGGADIVTLDLASNFAVTETPNTEINIDLSDTVSTKGITATTGLNVGVSGLLHQSGTIVHSTEAAWGEFPGNAQNSMNLLTGETTNATFTSLEMNNGMYSGVRLPSNKTFFADVNIVGRRTNTGNTAAGRQHAAYQLKACLHNDAYGTAVVGSVTKTVIAESNSAWDAQLAFAGAGSGQTDFLLVQCKGAASTNVHWVAKVDLLEVGGLNETSAYREANIFSNTNNELIP